ncbi:MAG: hypothetical protein Q7J35_00170 [Candidatus Methanoperedens sp.]|nr:hypothetical protein [Candidatus Methanoperedens sp.]
MNNHVYNNSPSIEKVISSPTSLPIRKGCPRTSAGSLPAGLRQWRSAEGRGLEIGERGHSE